MFIRLSGIVCRVLTASLVIITLLIIAFDKNSPQIGQTLHRLYYQHAALFPHFPFPKEDPPRDHSAAVIHFWGTFEQILRSVCPTAVASIRPERSALERSFNASDGTAIREDLIKLTAKEMKSLKVSHQSMIENIRHLVPELPYHAHTRGIVMTAGGPYTNILLVSLRMLRRVGSQLPVEVFLDTGSDYDHRLCEKILPALNAKCKVLSEIWSTTPSSEKLKSYQYKVFALLFSSFEDVLFLDADAFPAHNPDRILDEEPFKSTGLVTWPDFWYLSSSPQFYHIAVMTPPALNIRASSESGIMLFSKRKHGESLLLATYYNYYGPRIYYPLLSQGAGGEGDKETFLHAAMVMGEEFYTVKSPVTVIGRWMDEKWHSAGMKQADPTEDFKNQAYSRMGRAGALFVHNNNLKLDPKRVFDEDYHWKDGFGNVKRLWGDRESLVNEFGRDMEKEMWEELITVACTIGDDGCERARSHYQNVYLPNEGE